jgi:hypothetical protein
MTQLHTSKTASHEAWLLPENHPFLHLLLNEENFEIKETSTVPPTYHTISGNIIQCGVYIVDSAFLFPVTDFILEKLRHHGFAKVDETVTTSTSSTTIAKPMGTNGVHANS